MSNVAKGVVFAVILVAILSILIFLPQIEIDKNAVVSSSAWAWVLAAMYFLPIHTVKAILSVVIGLGIWALVVSVVKTIWDLLPFN